jgi:hypothetical protein
MTLSHDVHSGLNHLESRIDWRVLAIALLSVAFLGAVIWLAALGLDALNDMMARGLSSLSNPST